MVTTERLLRKMRADHDPTSWLVAADLLEELGMEGAAAGLRRRARLAMAISAALIEANRSSGRLALRYWPLEDSRRLVTQGGRKEMDVCIHDATRGKYFFHRYVRRTLMARQDYVQRRAQELADDYLEWEAAQGRAPE